MRPNRDVSLRTGWETGKQNRYTGSKTERYAGPKFFPHGRHDLRFILNISGVVATDRNWQSRQYASEFA